MTRTILFLLLAGIIIACMGQENKTSPTAKPVDGESLYKKHCVICHGINGKLGLNGSKDITISQLNQSEREVLIRLGKNTMTPFETILSPEEIKAVSEFTMTLK